MSEDIYKGLTLEELEVELIRLATSKQRLNSCETGISLEEEIEILTEVAKLKAKFISGLIKKYPELDSTIIDTIMVTGCLGPEFDDEEEE